ncbi:MAG: phage head spike fiber domain-containing protein, partial [Candidatus Puniceispirillaceae bacterium]
MRALGVSRTSLAPGGVLAGPWVRNELWRRARAVPTLDLRFADNKSLTDAVTGQSLVTFTRASKGTYVDSEGVIRTAVTNLLLRSEEFGDPYWIKTNSSITDNSIVAPNGTLTADKLNTNTTNGIHAVRRDETILANTAYTLTFFAKAAEYTFLAI